MVFVVMLASILLDMFGGFIIYVLTVGLYIWIVFSTGENGFKIVEGNWPGIGATLFLVIVISPLRAIFIQLWNRQVTEVKINEERMKKISDCFITFDSDSENNIRRVTALAAELLGADFAIYRRFEKGRFNTVAFIQKVKIDIGPLDPECKLSTMVMEQQSNDMVVVRNLCESRFKDAGAFIIELHLQTYAAKSVHNGENFTGIISVLFKHDAKFGNVEKELLHILASAIAVEEQRLQNENALLEKEALFRHVSDLTTDYIFRSKITDDGMTQLEVVMGAFERITGYSLEEYQSVGHWRKTIHPDDLKKDERDFQKLLNNEPVVSDIRTINKNGQISWMRVYAHPIWDEIAKKLVGISGAVKDITEIRRAEESLRASEERFKQLTEVFPETIFETNIKGTVTYANPQGLNQFGYTPEEIVAGVNIIDLVAPCDRSVVKNRIEGKNGGIDNEYVEFLAMRKDGSTFQSMGLTSLIITDGIPVGIRGINLDISKRKEAEHEMERLANRLWMATQAGGIGIWEYDVANNRHIWDEQMYRLYGITGGPFGNADETWLAGLHPDDKLGGYEAIRMALCGEKELNTEHRVVWPDGSIHNIRVFAQVQRDASSEALRMIGTNWDITKQKQAEFALKDQAVKLEEAIEKSYEASKLKSEFVANMSHEIRTPLSGILSMTELLAETELSEQQADYMKTVQESGRSLLTIVNDILDFSKIEAGKMSLEKIHFNIMDIIEETMSLFRSNAEAKGIELIVENLLTGSATYQGDPTRLKQILVNLVGNAIKFTKAGRITVNVEKKQDFSDNSVILFSVSDTGIGIHEDEKKKLFQPFIQGSASTTRQYGGSGLGLIITKQLVELMGGSINVESELGKGSTFLFTSTFTKGAYHEDVISRQQSFCVPYVVRSSNIRFDARILLAEDFRTNQKIALAILKKFGFMNVDIVENGNEVVNAAATGCYDLILMDVQMPLMDGRQATQKLRSMGNAIPIIGLTAYAILGDKEKCLASGMDEYVSKPINRQELHSVLEKYLGFAEPSSVSAEVKNSVNDIPFSLREGIFNREELLAQFDHDEEGVGILLSEFLSDLPVLLMQLEQFLQTDDPTNASRMAHGIKGGAGSLCCHTLSATALKLETACRQNNSVLACAQLEEAQVQYHLLRSAVENAGFKINTTLNTQE